MTTEREAEFVANLAGRTGLPEHVCRELLLAGWRYSEEIGRIPAWEHPSWSLLEPCGGRAERGRCVLPRGHNRGQLDVPSAHYSGGPDSP